MPKFDEKQFKQDCLEYQNKIRLEHGAPPLVHSQKLEDSAEKRAKELSSKGKMEHDDELVGIGENLLSFSGHEPSAELVIGVWAKEEENFNFTSGEFQEKCGHFTQLVWVNSEQFGIGIEQDKNGRYIVVGRYEPCGNYVGLFATNVLPKGSKLAQRTQNPSVGLKTLPDGKKFKKYLKTAHNKARDLHSAPALKWDKSLAEKALESAKEYVESKEKGTAEPKSLENLGRNILFATGGIPSIDDVCQSWYDGYKAYDYSKNEYSRDAGAFTQMVWHDSKTFGGAIFEKYNKCCVVCYYSPPGNVTNGYARNVLKPKSGTPMVFDKF